MLLNSPRANHPSGASTTKLNRRRMKYLFPFVLPAFLRAQPFGKCQRLFPAPIMVGWSLTLALALMTAATLRAAAPPTSLHITNTGTDSEGLQIFRLEWNAI